MSRPPTPSRANRSRSVAPSDQGSLFRLDSPLLSEIRGERSLMAFPLFALSKNAWMKPLTYQRDAVSIEVRPSATGVATIYDKEVVLYIASLMAAKVEAGEQVAQDFTFTAHDLFQVTGANHSARSLGASQRRQGVFGAPGSGPTSKWAEKARKGSSRGSQRPTFTISRPERASGD